MSKYNRPCRLKKEARPFFKKRVLNYYHMDENALIDVQVENIYKKFYHNLWQSIENIMRTHIDNPIEGELTKEKIRNANIMGLIHQEEQFPPKMDVSAKGVNLTLTSDILGVRQGDTLITFEGKRMPVSEIPVPWFEERFIYD